MPAQEQIVSRAAERRQLERDLGGPRFIYVVVEIIPVEPCDRPGYVCPITGDPKVKALEVIPDFSFLIDRETMFRYNSWGSAEHAEKVAKFAAIAEPIDRCTGLVAELRIQLKQPQSRVHILLDVVTEVIYLSGGWRSGKTFLMLMKWLRETLRCGGHGRRSWLIGPQKKNAWRMVEAVFRGRRGTPALVPTVGLDQYKKPRSALISGRLAKGHLANELDFTLIDGTSVEPSHTRAGAGHLEGEAAFIIAYDEARLDAESDAFDIMRGRVMADMGQVIVASVPDDDAPWLYEKVVSEAERQKQWDVPNVKCLELDGYGNPWVPDEAIDRAVKGESDPIVRDQKFFGKWTMRGMYAYTDVYDAVKHERDHLSHSAEAWNVGPDITRHVTRSMCRRVADYIVGVDFNWEPQTRVVFKVFGQQGDPKSWVFVVLDEVISLKCDAKTAARELWHRKNGKYRGAVVVADCNGFHSTHSYGGREAKNFDQWYYAEKKFKPVAPIETFNDAGKKTHSNPGIGESRTLIREMLREDHLLINAGSCPRTVNMMSKAPNRRKRKSDAGTWIDREIYNLEDCVRYVVWRCLSKHLVGKKPRPTANGMAIGAAT